jgi:hypothetical protein
LERNNLLVWLNSGSKLILKMAMPKIGLFADGHVAQWIWQHPGRRGFKKKLLWMVSNEDRVGGLNLQKEDRVV